jgi:hypothetical protein
MSYLNSIMKIRLKYNSMIKCEFDYYYHNWNPIRGTIFTEREQVRSTHVQAPLGSNISICTRL